MCRSYDEHIGMTHIWRARNNYVSVLPILLHPIGNSLVAGLNNAGITS